MFWKKKELPYPTEQYNNQTYYIVNRTDLDGLEKTRVVIEGVLETRPIIEYFSTGLPWDLEAHMEQDHGHQTTLSLDGVPVYMNGAVTPKLGDKITIYGEYNHGKIRAIRLETPDFIFCC